MKLSAKNEDGKFTGCIALADGEIKTNKFFESTVNTSKPTQKSAVAIMLHFLSVCLFVANFNHYFWRALVLR